MPGVPVRPGSGAPITARGRAIAYGPPPWRMRGRTLALWYRLRDPDEARRHVPPGLEMEADPVVRARFWDMEHDALAGVAPQAHAWQPFREAVVAFPVRHAGVSGDYPTYMYSDDFTYIAFGREVMGWPVRHGLIDIEADRAGSPVPGLRFEGRLRRDGRTIMTARLEVIGGEIEAEDSRPPRWLATKVIPAVTGPHAQVAQLVATGPQHIRTRRVWPAQADLSFGSGPTDELEFLAPREIVDAQVWSDVDLSIGWGEVLEELGEAVWGHD